MTGYEGRRDVGEEDIWRRRAQKGEDEEENKERRGEDLGALRMSKGQGDE